MEFKAQKNQLENLVSKVYTVVPSRSTLPALSSILIEVKENKIYMSATDLETSATAIEESGEISTEGAVALNSRDLYSIIKELPSSTVEFKVDNLLTMIHSEKGKFTMAGIEKDEFPTLMEIGKEHKVSIPHNILARGIDKVLFAVATGETEGESLGGALLDLQQGEFRLVATDRNKLALFKAKTDIDRIARLLISAKVWREVAKFSSGMEIAFEESRVGFYTENMIIVSRLIGKEFPPYEMAIPRDNDKLLIISRDELIRVLRRALVFTPEISKFIKITLSPNTFLMETASEIGESKEELPCKYEGAELEIGYNGEYLLSIITKIDSNEVKLTLKDKESPTLIMPTEQAENEELTYLLMPIRLE